MLITQMIESYAVRLVCLLVVTLDQTGVDFTVPVGRMGQT